MTTFHYRMTPGRGLVKEEITQYSRHNKDDSFEEDMFEYSELEDLIFKKLSGFIISAITGLALFVPVPVHQTLPAIPVAYSAFSSVASTYISAVPQSVFSPVPMSSSSSNAHCNFPLMLDSYLRRKDDDEDLILLLE